MSSIVSGNVEQYGDSRKLEARARLNSRYTIAGIGWFEWVSQNLPMKDGHSILDVGCGAGWFWEAVARQMPSRLDLTLVDQSAGMVREAGERCGKLAFATVTGRTADAALLPFPDCSFDGIVAMHMLYHVADKAQALAEFFRVLKPGGFLAVTTNDIGNMRELYEFTTVFGSPPHDPAGAAFGFGDAERLMHERFGNVTRMEHPARMRVTDQRDIFLALTSYPPGEDADEPTLASLREAIGRAFDKAGGALDVTKETGLFVSRKLAPEPSPG